MTDWLIDWLIDCLTDWLIDWIWPLDSVLVISGRISDNMLHRNPSFFYIYQKYLYGYWAFPEKYCTPPVEAIDFFEVEHPGFPVKFNMISLKFSIFLYWPPWKSMFFPQLVVRPLGIPMTFTLPPWNFQLISSTGGGGYNFFPGKGHLNWNLK